ncbi:hypothetical protein KAK06_02530 [Ideonella sp. 4Y11]|uniref:Lipoprotein n=1 Tax=Ideonella aquatica TaxID=2824119 RepID=A0A941BJT1_9BURK|nr:hypothetical protein [Ideonella aquatica]MBQ0957824.1 hypothetical protein [Ideonella aquatica]
MRATRLIALSALALLVSACGERPQTGEGPRKKADTKAATGTDNGYAAAGWTQGDETGWNNQLRARAQQGQNEYTRSPAAPKTP